MWNESERNRVLSVHALAAQGQLKAAILAARTALADGVVHPLLLNLIAINLEEEGRYDDALETLNRALTLAPDDFACRNAKGLLLLRMERAEEALPEFDRVLQLDPSLPFAHVNRGNALKMMGALGAGEVAYQRALAIDPGDPMALAGLAAVTSARGDYQRARVAAQMALQKRPALVDAVFALAAADIASGDLPAAEKAMEAVLSDASFDDEVRAQALTMQGDIKDSTGNYAAAFASYTHANQLLRERHRATYAPSLSANGYVHRLIETLDKTNAAQWATAKRDGAAVGHVFLIGFPRSGTTLLEVILTGSPQVASLEEKESLIDGVRRYLRDPSNLDDLMSASEAELEHYRDAYWDSVLAQGVDLAGKVFVDKYPLNTLKLPLIAKLFPDAKIIFAVRDPRDVVLSCYRRRFRMSAPMYEFLSLDSAANYYNAVMHLADRCLKLSGMSVLEVRHEDLVANFEGQMDAVCRFIGLQWSQVMADFAGRAKVRPYATPSTAQIAGGLSRRTVQHWRNYDAELGAISQLLSYWVERFHYEK